MLTNRTWPSCSLSDPFNGVNQNGFKLGRAPIWIQCDSSCDLAGRQIGTIGNGCTLGPCQCGYCYQRRDWNKNVCTAICMQFAKVAVAKSYRHQFISPSSVCRLLQSTLSCTQSAPSIWTEGYPQTVSVLEPRLRPPITLARFTSTILSHPRSGPQVIRLFSALASLTKACKSGDDLLMPGHASNST